MARLSRYLFFLIAVILIFDTIVLGKSSNIESKSIDNRDFFQSSESSKMEMEIDNKLDSVQAPDKSRMIERFMKRELSEDELRSMAKMRNREEEFSYENEGYGQMYYRGPSYEGYSKMDRLFGRLFEQISDDVDPREIKQYCNDTTKIADIVIIKLKEKLGNLQSICKRFEEQEAKCAEYVKIGCSRIGTAIVRENATEIEKIQSVAYSCPPNPDAIKQACKTRSLYYMGQRIKNADELCSKRFDFEGERLLKECERFRQSNICNKEKFIERCMFGIKKEDFERKKCTEKSMPSCVSGQTLQKKTDEQGCVYYYCATACKSIEKPNCNPDEKLETYYDTSGCITSYQCIKQQQTCPEVSKPSCSEGQSLTTKYDDKRCIVGYECVNVIPTDSLIKIIGNVILETYDDFLKNCENSWAKQEAMCSKLPATCDKDTFIQRCKEREKMSEDFISQIDLNCETKIIPEIKSSEKRCDRIDEDKQRCVEESTKRCERMKGMAQQCRENLTEEKLRNFIIEEANKRCKFIGITPDEDDIRKAEKAEIILAVLNTATKEDLDKLGLFVDKLTKQLELQDTTVYKGVIEPSKFVDVKLLPFVVNAKLSTFVSSERAKEVKERLVAKQKFKDAASKLTSLRDSDLPSEYLYIIEDKASDVLDASDELEDVEKKEEQKGFGYKIKLFFGLAKKAEQEEIKQLRESKGKLSSSIEALTKLTDEVPSDVAKAILKEQVENLKKQQDNIDALIKSKEKKAKGLFGVFG